MGNFVHEVLEELYQVDPDLRSTDKARQIARKLWDEKYITEVEGYVHKSKYNDFRWNSWFCIENLWQVEDPSRTELDGIEYELNGLLEGVAVKGFIDRFVVDEADGGIIISDYKTGKVPALKWEEDKFFQLWVYAAVMEAIGVGKTKRLDLIYLKKPTVITRMVTNWEIDAAIEVVVNTRKGIDQRCETGNFEPNKTNLCNWCAFKSKCPAWNA
jgi:putative RecB family exonuclease